MGLLQGHAAIIRKNVRGEGLNLSSNAFGRRPGYGARCTKHPQNTHECSGLVPRLLLREFQVSLTHGRIPGVCRCSEIALFQKKFLPVQDSQVRHCLYLVSSTAFMAKTLPLPCVFVCRLHGEDTAFALCLRLPSWRRHCLCFVSSTAFMAKTLPFLALLLAGADEPQRGLAGTAPPGPDRRNRRHSARGLWCVSIT